MSSIGAIRKKIEDAFAVAREQGPTTSPKQPARDCDVSTKQSNGHYTETDDHQFHRRADALIGAAARSPHAKLHRHRANSYYVGDINEQPCAEDLFAEAAKRYSEGSGGKTAL